MVASGIGNQLVRVVWVGGGGVRMRGEATDRKGRFNRRRVNISSSDSNYLVIPTKLNSEIWFLLVIII